MNNLTVDEKKKFVEYWERRISSFNQEIEDTRRKLSIEDLPLSEILSEIDLIYEKLSKFFEEVMSLLSPEENVTLHFYVSLISTIFTHMKFLFLLEEENKELREALKSVSTEIAKIKGKVIDNEEAKTKFKGFDDNLLMNEIKKQLDSLEKIPIKQVLIQLVQGNNYGNVTQALESTSDFNLRVQTIFKQAKALVETESNVSLEQRETIRKNVDTLEKELLKKEPDISKIENLWKWLRQNSSWLVPIITPIIEECAKKAFGA